MIINKSFIKRKIAGTCVLVPTGDTSRELNGFFHLSETAEFLWDHLEKADSLEILIDMLINEFDIDYDTARKDTMEFVARLLSVGFIRLSDPETNW